MKKKNFLHSTRLLSIQTTSRTYKTIRIQKSGKNIAETWTMQKVWIRLDDEILKLYRDRSGNMTFKDFLLQDISISEQNAPSTSAKQVDETLIQLFEK